jgi:glycosyltransferase involved in cell wall biosynthesis
MIFIGPSPLAGIGQLVLKYVELYKGEYYQLSPDLIIPENEDVFMFALPTPEWLHFIPEIISKSKRVICMTICETATVHAAYGPLFELLKNVTIVVPSEFCRDVFSKQFPSYTFEIIHAYIPLPRQVSPILTLDFPTETKYVFYHIGNVIDPRKNFRSIISAFTQLNKPDAYMIVKATCIREVTIEHPNIIVINGLHEQDLINEIHSLSDCYVSCSFSEGIGLGAVEAALRDKPVIIAEYGGAAEYVKTPYTVKCGLKNVGVNDFLFESHMQWGDPDIKQLCDFMEDAYTKKLKTMVHNHTRTMVSSDTVTKQFTTILC